MQDGVLVKYLMTLVDVMDTEFSVAPGLLYEAAGIEPLVVTNANDRVSTDAADRLWQAAATLADDTLGLKMGAAVRYTSYASLGHLLVTSETVGDAIRAGTENAHYVGAGHFKLTETADELQLEYVLDSSHPIRELRAVASLVPFSTLAKSVTDGVLPTRVWVQASGAGLSELYSQYFGLDVSFGAATSGVAWSKNVLTRPMRDANPALNEVLLRHLKRELSEQGSVVTRVETFIDQILARGGEDMALLNLDHCAQVLGMPRRSLQRALADEGYAFRDILGRIRCARAEKKLAATKQPIADIATSLGYSEAAAFVRAFKARKNISPSRYRANCQNKSND